MRCLPVCPPDTTEKRFEDDITGYLLSRGGYTRNADVYDSYNRNQPSKARRAACPSRAFFVASLQVDTQPRSLAGVQLSGTRQHDTPKC